jgi:hypothetical protein
VNVSAGDNTFNFRPQRVPVKKKSSMYNNNNNARVVHFPNETLEYDDDSDERINPLTNHSLTNGIPKLPIPKMK